MVISETEKVENFIIMYELTVAQFATDEALFGSGWPRVVALCRSITNAWWWMHIDCLFVLFFHHNNNIDAVTKSWMPKREQFRYVSHFILSLWIFKHGSKIIQSMNCFIFVLFLFFKAIYFNFLFLVNSFVSNFILLLFRVVFWDTQKESFLAENREKVPDQKVKAKTALSFLLPCHTEMFI